MLLEFRLERFNMTCKGCQRRREILKGIYDDCRKKLSDKIAKLTGGAEQSDSRTELNATERTDDSSGTT